MEKHLKMLPLALFTAVAVKSLINSVSYVDAILALASAVIFSYLLYLENRKQKDEIKELLLTQAGSIEELTKRVDDLSTHVATSKLSNMRSVR